MGLHNTAHYLKTKGRNDDTELVHMTKGEVQALKGLAAKHGGDLTTNPETGLPEAGFLSAILPAVAGIATAAFAPELLPLVAGGVGLADYAVTGSIGQGLMAGLSAYGAGGVGESLSALGATTPGVESADIAVEQGMDPTQAFAKAQSNIDPSQLEGMSRPDVMAQNAINTSTPAASNLQAMGQGLNVAANAPGQFLMNNAANVGMAAAPILTGALGNNRSTIPVASTANTNPMGLKTLSPDFKGSFPTQPNPAYVAQYPDYKRNPYQPGVPNTLYPSTPGTYSGGYTPTTMREGGSVPSYSGEYGSVVGIENATQELESLYGPRPVISSPTPSVGIVQDTDPNTRNLSPYEAALYRVKQKASAAGLGKNAVVLPAASTTYGKINPDATPEVQEAAGGGIMGAPSLGGYASGGNPRLLKGPGDGMSDSIPANIGGKQPARLADGEFVVPADVVSHLGNGSTDAGAKKLYSMMDNIRRARTGRKKQAPAVKPEKYLPK